MFDIALLMELVSSSVASYYKHCGPPGLSLLISNLGEAVCAIE
jgi:hypothetical protein